MRAESTLVKTKTKQKKKLTLIGLKYFHRNRKTNLWQVQREITEITQTWKIIKLFKKTYCNKAQLKF